MLPRPCLEYSHTICKALEQENIRAAGPVSGAALHCVFALPLSRRRVLRPSLRGTEQQQLFGNNKESA